jgi:hypothetical protein
MSIDVAGYFLVLAFVVIYLVPLIVAGVLVERS